jgi:hypothetical protein
MVALYVRVWLTVPLFVLAWPVALLTDNLPLTFAVFVGVFVAWRWGGGLGPADGKIAVGLAGMAPTALGIGVLLEMIAIAVLRSRGQHNDAIPGALWFFLGVAFSTVLWSTLAVAGLSSYR